MSKVSIIMPAYNAAATIGTAIKSVHAQGIADVEIIVADDCSQDNTRALIKSMMAGDPTIKLLELTQNGGASAARNAALDIATGEWIALLDADDWWETPRLSTLLKTAAEYNADVVYDNIKIYDDKNGPAIDQTCFGHSNWVTAVSATMFIDNDNVLMPFGMGYLQPIMKRELLEKHKIRYDLSHRIGEDFKLQLEMLLCGGKCVLIPQAYYAYIQRMMLSADIKTFFARAKPGQGSTIIRACDELLAKYGATMTVTERDALLHRRYIFESRVRCDAMIGALREKHLGKALLILAMRPHILVLNLATIRKMLRTKWLKLRRNQKLRQR